MNIVSQRNSIFGDHQTYLDIIMHRDMVNGSLNLNFPGVRQVSNAMILVQRRIIELRC